MGSITGYNSYTDKGVNLEDHHRKYLREQWDRHGTPKKIIK